MTRLVDASEVFRETVPGELVPVVWAVTLLGSAKFLLVALSVAYWNADERREAVLAVVATAFVALALTLVLKYSFDLPRPPEAGQRYPVDPSPVGFPSGHAIAATTVYGGALVAVDRHRDVRAVVGVGALVLAVGLSRVVLGVHYLGDVLAGVAVGLVALAVLWVALDRGPAVVFALAALLAVPALLVVGESGAADAGLALGGSLGALAATRVEFATVGFRSSRERVVLTAVGLVFVALAVGVTEAVESLALGRDPRRSVRLVTLAGVLFVVSLYLGLVASIPAQFTLDGQIQARVALAVEDFLARPPVCVTDRRVLVTGDQPPLLSPLQVGEFVFRPVRERVQSRRRRDYSCHRRQVRNDGL